MIIENVLIWIALLLLLSILASKVSSYLGVPALLLFLLIGMLAGSEGPGGVYFDDPGTAQLLGVVALALILFAGGLDTQLDDIRPVLGQGLVLSTVGVLGTALLVGWFAKVWLGLSWAGGVLLGAIVSSTDAAAVFSVLRGKSIGLKDPLKPLLELESGSNDPMAIFLTLGMIRLLQAPDASVWTLIPLFVQQMAVGAAAGVGIGWLMVVIINRLHLEYDGLYPVLTIGIVLLLYGATTALGGNGFLAVYLAGIVAGNDNFIHKASLRRFHEGMAWLMQIVMFLTLGLLVFPSDLLPIADEGVLVALFLMGVARPLSVFVALARTRMSMTEKAFVAWVGLRGAAPIILATFPLLAGLAKAHLIFNLVFFIVLTSALVQGTTLSLVARVLGVDQPNVRKRRSPLELVASHDIKSDLVELTVPADEAVVGRQLVSLGLPPGTLIVLLGRGDECMVPTGSTTLEAGDVLLVLADRAQLSQVRTILAGERLAYGK